jgi:hypothetical protein
MVSKGLAGAAALAFSLASVGAFAPGRAFVKAPLSPATYGITEVANVEGVKVRSVFCSSRSYGIKGFEIVCEKA